MKCPQCNYQFKEKAKHCPACGLALDERSRELLELSRDFREGLQELLDIKGQFNDVLHDLRQRIDKFDALARPLISGLARDAQPVKETATVAPQATPVRSETTQDPARSAEGSTDTPPVYSAPPRRETLPPPPRSAGKGSDSSGLEVRLGEKWLLVVGLIAMVFASGYFIKYSFDQGWVGPAGRVAMAYLMGMVLVAGGDHFRRQTLRMYGLYLTGGGVAVLYTATYLAYDWYDLLPQVGAFGLMVLITLFTGFLSLRHDSMGLAVIGLAGGFLTPVFCSSGRDAQVALMTYMTILNIGVFVLAFKKRWHLLNSLGFIFTWILFSGWMGKHFTIQKFWITFCFQHVFYAIYTLAPLVHAIYWDPLEKVRGTWIVVLNSFISFGYSFFLLYEYTDAMEWVALATVVYSAVFLGIATWMRRQGAAQSEPFVIFTAMAGLFLVITVPLLFSRHWISLFWFAQVLALGWMARRLKREDLLRGTLLLLTIVLVKFCSYDLFDIFRLAPDPFRYVEGWDYLAMERLLTFTVALLSLFGLARMMTGPTVFKGFSGQPAFYWTIFGIMLFGLLNIEVMGWCFTYLPRAHYASVSLLWSLFAIVSIIMGFRLRIRALRRVAIALFVLTAVKVFFSDMVDISTPWRILTFFILGAVLMGASYLYHRYRHLLADPDDEPADDSTITDYGRIQPGS